MTARALPTRPRLASSPSAALAAGALVVLAVALVPLAIAAGHNLVTPELDTGGRVAARLSGYRAAGATWWLESPGSGPGWMDAVRNRLQRGPWAQPPRG